MNEQEKREKVISLLERYIEIPNLAGAENYGAKIVDMPAPLVADAIALLKSHEPVEPKKNYVELAGLRTWDWACPECNCILTYRANYCSCCGRAVKWDE